MEPLIRLAVPDDIPTMMLIAGQIPTAAHWSKKQYESVFDPAVCRLATMIEQSSVMAGFLIARCPDRDWELENIVISNTAQRSGLGSQLLGDFVRRAHKAAARTIFLEVRATNIAACAFYAKWAFQQYGVRRNYYLDPEEDAILYRLSLQ